MYIYIYIYTCVYIHIYICICVYHVSMYVYNSLFGLCSTFVQQIIRMIEGLRPAHEPGDAGIVPHESKLACMLFRRVDQGPLDLPAGLYRAYLEHLLPNQGVDVRHSEVPKFLAPGSSVAWTLATNASRASCKIPETSH